MKTKSISSQKNKTQQKKPIKESDLITVFLLCDNPGYRMKSYGPLSLVDINNTKLIDHQIQSIHKVFKNYELVVCVGFDAEKICKHIRNKYGKYKNIRLVENQLYNFSNSCESLRLCLNNTLNKKILICDGNLFINPNSLHLINTDKSCALFEKDPCENLEIGFNKDDFNLIQHFSYGARYTWSEIFYINGDNIVESLRKIIVSYDSKTRFIFEAINELIKMQYEIKAIQNPNKIIKINNIKTYHALKDLIK